MNFNFSKEEFEKALEKGSSLLFKKITTDRITPVLASLKIFDKFPNHHFLFESAEKGNNKGRFSVIGFMPDLIWKSKGEESFINDDFVNNPQNFKTEKGNVLDNFRNLVKKSQIDWSLLAYGSAALPSVCSGVFGFMSYDMVRLMEKIPNRNLPDEINIPESIFIRPQIVIIFDNFFDCALICAPVFAAKDVDI